MPIPLIAAGIGAAVTLGKMFNDNAQADRQNRIRADEMQYSPWTHMKMSPMQVKTSDPWGTGASAVGPLGSAVDDAMKARSLEDNSKRVDDKMDQAGRIGDSFSLPHFGSALDTPASSPGLTSNPGPLYYKDNGSLIYNQGDPQFSLLSPEDSQRAMGVGNGTYGGYDQGSGGSWWSPYGGR